MVIFDVAEEKNHSEWKRCYLARTMALILYEIAEDIPSILGKKFQVAMKTLSVPEEMIKKLNSEKNKFSEFWRTHHGLLKNIRSNVVAHREHNAMEQLRVIDEINIFEMPLAEHPRQATGE